MTSPEELVSQAEAAAQSWRLDRGQLADAREEILALQAERDRLGEELIAATERAAHLEGALAEENEAHVRVAAQLEAALAQIGQLHARVEDLERRLAEYERPEEPVEVRRSVGIVTLHPGKATWMSFGHRFLPGEVTPGTGSLLAEGEPATLIPMLSYPDGSVRHGMVTTRARAGVVYLETSSRVDARPSLAPPVVSLLVNDSPVQTVPRRPIVSADVAVTDYTWTSGKLAGSVTVRSYPDGSSTWCVATDNSLATLDVLPGTIERPAGGQVAGGASGIHLPDRLLAPAGPRLSALPANRFRAVRRRPRLPQPLRPLLDELAPEGGLAGARGPGQERDAERDVDSPDDRRHRCHRARGGGRGLFPRHSRAEPAMVPGGGVGRLPARHHRRVTDTLSRYSPEAQAALKSIYRPWQEDMHVATLAWLERLGEVEPALVQQVGRWAAGNLLGRWTLLGPRDSTVYDLPSEIQVVDPVTLKVSGSRIRDWETLARYVRAPDPNVYNPSDAQHYQGIARAAAAAAVGWGLPGAVEVFGALDVATVKAFPVRYAEAPQWLVEPYAEDKAGLAFYRGDSSRQHNRAGHHSLTYTAIKTKSPPSRYSDCAIDCGRLGIGSLLCSARLRREGSSSCRGRCWVTGEGDPPPCQNGNPNPAPLRGRFQKDPLPRPQTC